MNYPEKLIKHHTEALELAVVIEWSGRKKVKLCEYATEAINYLNSMNIDTQDIIDAKMKYLRNIRDPF